MSQFPLLLHTAVDAQDCRELAEFYRRLLGLHYREGEEPPTDGSPDDADWLVLLDGEGSRVLTVQKKKGTTPPTWPAEDVPIQMHMDFTVPSVERLLLHRERAEQLGRGYFMTAHRTRANRSTSSPIRLDTPSACS